MKHHKDGFALLGSGEVLFGRLVRGRKPLRERLGNGCANGTPGGGAGDSGGLGGLGPTLGFISGGGGGRGLPLGGLLHPLNVIDHLLNKGVGVQLGRIDHFAIFDAVLSEGGADGGGVNV